MDQRASKEFGGFPESVQDEFFRLVKLIEKQGELTQPLGKKFHGYKNLFEMRVRISGAWRAIYSYLPENKIIILHFFQKKTQATPLREIKTAQKRLNDH